MNVQHRHVFTRLFSVALLAALILAACGQNATAENNVIKIGMIIYSPDKIAGYSMTNPAAMIQDELKASNGVTVNGKQYQISIITDIINNTPQEAVTAAQKLINQENVAVVIGPGNSGLAIPAGEVAEKSKVPLVTNVASNPDVTKDRQYVFRMCFVDDFQGKALANFASKQLNAKTAAVLYEVSDPYSRGVSQVFKDQFTQNGGKVSNFEQYTADKLNYDTQLAAIKAANPDVVLFPNGSEDSQAQVVQARKLGITAQFVGADAWDPVGFQKVPEFADSYMTSNFASDSTNDRSIAFVKAYQTRFKIIPGDTAALTYDAFGIVLQAIRTKNATTSQEIRDALYSMPAYDGVSGSIKFTDSGDPVRSAVIIKIGKDKYGFFTEVKPQ